MSLKMVTVPELYLKNTGKSADSDSVDGNDPRISQVVDVRGHPTAVGKLLYNNI